MPVVEVEQNTAAWLQCRIGRVTASRIGEAIAKYKSEKKASAETAERRKYRLDLVSERMTNRSTENFISPEMIWGTENEPSARAAYEIERDEMTEKVGFIVHPRFEWAGASPDALIGINGGLEIKCPKTTTFLTWWEDGELQLNRRESVTVPEEHQPQVLWNMACAEREWWDFAAYDPRLPEGTRLQIVRMYRDEKRIKAMEDAAEIFNEQVEAMCAELRQRVKVAPVEVVPELEDWPTSFAEFTGMDEVAP